MTNNEIKFGWLDENQVVEFEFCDDPDGSGLRWFQPTGHTISIAEYEYLSTDQRNNSGRCVDTDEFESRAGELLFRMLAQAPAEARLAVVSHSWGVRTRTFEETVSVKFYS